MEMSTNDFPIQRLETKINFQVKIEEEIEKEEIELGLGLSLNGRFGVDPKRLKRCSSKPDLTDESTPFPTMVRSCSLPVDWMKRKKELQTLRRIEARRKRLEKRRNFEIRQGVNNKSTKSRIPVNTKTSSEEPNEEESLTQNPESEEMVRKLMSRMPCVSTTGDGPNGRRIRGLLYPNNRGEEVKIVCVCHGSCYSPAEFVKHAGGLEVANPLRRIVVTPSSLF